MTPAELLDHLERLHTDDANSGSLRSQVSDRFDHAVREHLPAVIALARAGLTMRDAADLLRLSAYDVLTHGLVDTVPEELRRAVDEYDAARRALLRRSETR
jgi:hypothetical protein